VLRWVCMLAVQTSRKLSAHGVAQRDIVRWSRTDETGDVVGLDEVQLLDPHDERRGVLRDLVRHADEAVALLLCRRLGY